METGGECRCQWQGVGEGIGAGDTRSHSVSPTSERKCILPTYSLSPMPATWTSKSTWCSLTHKNVIIISCELCIFHLPQSSRDKNDKWSCISPSAKDPSCHCALNNTRSSIP